ncbi:GH39 family glycosyl hydrolase [Myxosarcina sp. GI1(2024)]
MKRRDLIKLTGIGAASAFMSYGLHRYPDKKYASHKLLDSSTSLAADPEAIATTVKINWSEAIAQSTPLMFGSNDYEIISPHKARDNEFQRLLAQLNIPLVRIHHTDLSDRWSNEASKTWDEAKIKAGFDASYPQNPVLVQNIPRWPKWMTTDETGLLAADEYDNYANFCAELVTIINQRQQRNVIYWEPLNELETRYEKQGKLDQLWKLYNRSARVMKARDPKIKIGGPTLTWDNKKLVAKFLRECVSNVDFISWHRYGTGNPEESTDKLMSRTPMYKQQVRKLRSVVAKHSGDRHIPLFLSEYNINYYWKSGEKRQNTHIGAVWFASVLKHLVEAEIDMAASWHLKDGIYGMIDPDNNLRPAASVFAWGNQYLVGTVMSTESKHSAIESLALEQADRSRSLLLINKSSYPARITLLSTPNIFSGKKIEGFTLNENGITNFNNAATIFNSQPLRLKPLSLLLLRLDDRPSSGYGS